MRFGGHKSWPIMRQIMDDLKFLPKKNPKNFLKKFCIRFGEKDFLEKLFNQFFDKNAFWGHKSWPEMWPIIANRSRSKNFWRNKSSIVVRHKIFFLKTKKNVLQKNQFYKSALHALVWGTSTPKWPIIGRTKHPPAKPITFSESRQIFEQKIFFEFLKKILTDSKKISDWATK